MDLALDGEAQLGVDERVDTVAAFEVTGAVLQVSLPPPQSRMSDQLKHFPVLSDELQRKLRGESAAIDQRTYLLSHILDQLPRIPLPPRGCFRADVHEIPRLVVALGEHVVLGVVQQRQEFVEEALFAFGGELVVEAPQAAAENGAPVVHVFARWHPRFEGGQRHHSTSHAEMAEFQETMKENSP